MSWATPEVLLLTVFAGAFIQSATGVGFGVAAGPVLLLAYGYDRAIVETAVFSLLAALVTAVLQARRLDPRATIGLTLALPVGVALGAAVLWLAPRAAVIALFGAVLCGLGIVLVLQSLRRAVPAEPPARFRFGPEMTAAAILAGAGAMLFAAPGPAAAWGLARAHLAPAAIRGTLAVYFIPAYAAILAVFAATGALDNAEWASVAAAAPVCIAGALTGLFLGAHLPGGAMRVAVGAIVTASGVSILAPVVRAVL